MAYKYIMICDYTQFSDFRYVVRTARKTLKEITIIHYYHNFHHNAFDALLTKLIITIIVYFKIKNKTLLYLAVFLELLICKNINL